jgi:hypothetical protein
MGGDFMVSVKKDKEFLLKVCSDIIDNNINTMDDLRRIWPKASFQSSFLNNLFEDIVDSFEHIPGIKGEGDKASFEYLRIYLIQQILEHKQDIVFLEEVYKKIIVVERLTKEKIDEILKNIFEK